MHFIEHKLLKETEENVGAIYLEEPEDRHLRALCGIEIRKPIHLPDCEVEESVVDDALTAVVKADDRLHLYSHFGSVVAEHLLDEIRFLVSARNCRYILLDHLTMVNSGNSEADERRAIDFLTTRLEMMVKELQFSLIVVSHVNDNGQTRGSRYPTKVFDITITATRDLQALDLNERNTIQLRVLFNRYCSSTGPAGRITFHPETYSFTEESNDDYTSRSNSNRMVNGTSVLGAV
jgi:twinkle protein